MKYRKNYTVTLSDLDCTNAISPVAICNKWQDATTHFLDTIDSTGFKLQKIGYTWIINGMTLEFAQILPEFGKKIEIETWALNNTGVKLLRDFEAKNEDGEIIAKCISSWAVINVDTRKPVIYEPFSSILKTDTHSVLPELRAGKFDFPLEAKIENEFVGKWEVKKSDLDFNNHANNLKYMQEYLDSVPAEFLVGRYLKRFYIQYRAELFLGDTVTIFNYKVGESFYQKMVRKSDGLIISVAKSEFI